MVAFFAGLVAASLTVTGLLIWLVRKKDKEDNDSGSADKCDGKSFAEIVIVSL